MLWLIVERYAFPYRTYDAYGFPKHGVRVKL